MTLQNLLAIKRLLAHAPDGSALRMLLAAAQRNLADARVPAISTDTLDALVLFKNDMGSYVRLYAFLSQVFDYGNTDVEKRFIFYKRLIPLLEFGRECDTVDLSRVVLTHHTLRSAAGIHSTSRTMARATTRSPAWMRWAVARFRTSNMPCWPRSSPR